MSATIYRRYPIGKLQVGMFISSLEGEELENTPFPAHGFYIKTKDDIWQLAKYSNIAVVNMARSKIPEQVGQMMQIHVQDVPYVISGKKSLASVSAYRSSRPVRKHHQGRAKRLMVLMLVSGWALWLVDFLNAS